jgi:hypothetical protein
MEWRPHPLEPLLVAPARQVVLGKGVVIAVEDEPDRINQGSIQVKQCGLEFRHPQKLVGTWNPAQA